MTHNLAYQPVFCHIFVILAFWIDYGSYGKTAHFYETSPIQTQVPRLKWQYCH